MRATTSARDLLDPNLIYGSLVGTLIARRHALSISQRDLNRRCGIADDLIAKYEAGERHPSIATLCIWAASLNSYLGCVGLSAPPELKGLAEVKPWRRRARKRSPRRVA